MRLLAIGAVRVEDASMQPALRPGDRLVTSRWLPLHPGDLIVFRDPEAPSALLVKRVASVRKDGLLEVRGDNVNASRDSRHFGAIPPSLVLGRVFFRYLPHDRRGVL